MERYKVWAELEAGLRPVLDSASSAQEAWDRFKAWAGGRIAWADHTQDGDALLFESDKDKFWIRRQLVIPGEEGDDAMVGVFLSVDKVGPGPCVQWWNVAGPPWKDEDFLRWDGAPKGSRDEQGAADWIARVERHEPFMAALADPATGWEWWVSGY